VRVTHLNYADGAFYNSQRLNSESARRTKSFARVVGFSRQDLPERFLRDNAGILNEPRGAGYWLWKPALIDLVLQELPDGEACFYTDAGTVFVADPEPLIAATLAEQDIAIFTLEPQHTEAVWSKRDCTILLDFDAPGDVATTQLMATFVIARASAESRAFVASWLEACRDPRILTDSPSELGPERPEFREHRHDQSVLSILYKKAGYRRDFVDPTQWGDQFEAQRRAQGYGRVFQHTRDRR
jgi:hypothetical protein